MKTNLITKKIANPTGLFTLLSLLLWMLLTPKSYAGMMDEPIVSKLMIDKLELSDQEDNPLIWDTEFWIMKGIKKVVLESSGESVSGNTDSENRLLFSQGIAPYWDLQAGFGHDVHEDNTHNWGIIGISGMAPYFFETKAHALVDGDGTLGLRLSAEYEALISQRLILTPEIEAEAYSDGIPELQIGSGLSSAALGLRLRYEIRREFAPYIGVEWHKTFGETADYHDDDLETAYVAGLRIWF